MISALDDCGYTTFSGDEKSLREFTRLLKQQGFQTSETQLHVKSSEKARAGTLSSKYAKGRFPFHTDFAFRPLPPRYIVLANTSTSEHTRGTLVSLIESLDSAKLALVRKSSWRLANRHGSFLVNSFSPHNNKPLYKWDSDVFSPANNAAIYALKYFDLDMKAAAFRMHWTPKSAIIIDNWRCVHAREDKTSDAEYDRALLRIEIWHHAGMDIRYPVQQGQALS